MIARDEMETSEGGYLSKQGDQPVYTQRDPKKHQNHIERLKALLSTIRSCPRIIPGREAIALEPERREVLDGAFGRYGTEAILLASQPGRILWTDDNRMARFASTEHGVRRVWTQVLLQHGLESGRITQEHRATPVGGGYALVTILSGFAINNIGRQPTIRSAITVPPCSTPFGSGSVWYFASFVAAAV